MSRPIDFPDYFLKNPPKLTEDGFCEECGDFYSECMCEAYWIRLASKQKKHIIVLKEKIKELEDILKNK